MGLVILMLFVAVPLLELSILIEVGSDIGAVATIALCLLTAGVGLSLIRMQGLKVIADLQAASAEGGPIVEPVIHGFFLLVAGLFLFFPGFMTDALGGLLLVPPIRLMLGRLGIAKAAAKRTQSFRYSKHTESGKATVIIDGDFTEMGTEEREPGENPWAKRSESITDSEKSDEKDPKNDG